MIEVQRITLKKMKKLCLMLTVLTALSCHPKKEKVSITEFNLTEIPDALSGCSCLFSNSKKDYESDKFIYFDDLGDHCLISVNHEIVLLQKENDKYSSDAYTAYLQNKIQIDEGYESAIYQAELVIIDKKGGKSTYKVYGICGC
jgi:hypothetical protein